MKLVNPYHLLYTKIYLQLCAVGTVNIVSAVIFLMSAIEMLNFLVLACLIDIFFDIQIFKMIPDLTVNNVMLFGGFLWPAAHFIYFYYRGRYKRILLEFNVESKLKEPYCYLPGLIYVVSSVFAMFLLIPLRSKYGIH